MAELGRGDLQSLAENTNIEDNTTEGILPVDVRNQYENERDSTLNKVDDGLEVLDVVVGKLLAYSDDIPLISLTDKCLTSKNNVLEISTESINTHVGDSDPHPQYLNDVRGDSRYYQKSEVDTSQGLQDTAININTTNSGVNATNIGVNTTNISDNTTLIGVNSININNNANSISNIESEQLTQNNAIALNTAKVSADGSVNTHSDVDLTGVTIGNGFVLKYDGGNFIPCLNNVYYAPTLIINNTNVLDSVINQSVDVQRLKPHKISISYAWSMNDAARDFILEASFGGLELQQGLTNNAEIHRQEVKDVAGTSPDGRGTDQIHRFKGDFFVTPTTLGINVLSLEFASSTAGDLASIWDVKVEIEEYTTINLI